MGGNRRCVIPRSLELIPRLGEATNVPTSSLFIPYGYTPMLFNDLSMPSMVLPQAPVSREPPVLFSTLPVFTGVQPTTPRQWFEPPTFLFQGPQFQPNITYVTPDSYTKAPQYEFPVKQEIMVKNPKQETMARKMKSLEQSLKNMQGRPKEYLLLWLVHVSPCPLSN